MFFLLIGISCTKKEETIYKYEEPKAIVLDATSTWLQKEENFFKANYITVLQQFYNANIAKKEYQKAAKALEIAANKANRFQSFSDALNLLIEDFNQKYASYIQEEKDLWFIPVYRGQYYANKGQFEKAIRNFQELENVEVTDYESCYFKASNYMRIAWSNFNLGKQDLAISNNFKALALLQQTDQKDVLGSVYFYIYPVYLAAKDYKNAEIYLDKAIAHYNLKSKKNETNLFICLYNKIELLSELERNEERNKLVDSVLVAFKKRKIKDPSMKVSLYLLDFSKKIDNEELDKAARLLEEIKEDVKLLDSDYTYADYNKAVALLQIKKDKRVQNPKLIIDAIPKFKEENSFQDIMNAYDILYQDALNREQYKSALDYYALYQDASDSLGNEKLHSKVIELETKYQTQQKEQEIKVQKETISKKNAAIGTLIAIFLVLILGLMLYVLRQKQKRMLIEKQQSQKFTKNLLDKTEEERKRIASDLHDSVSHELLNLKTIFEQNQEELNSKIDTIINDIRTISRNLHPVLFDKIGLQSSIENLVERMQNKHDFMIATQIEYSNTLSKETELQLYRIIQEALSNIIKYANAIAAKVSFVEKDGKYLLEIVDNGQGFSVEETLLQKDAFGLHNILERSKAIGGKAQIVSNEKGTKITVTL